MKYTLVCKNEIREAGYRAVDVYDTIPWDPAPDHMWVECPDDYVPDSKWFDPADNTLKDFPPPPPPIPLRPAATEAQPTTTGTTTL